jgi:hypothetical protein
MTRMTPMLVAFAAAAALAGCAGGGGPDVGPNQPYAYDGYAFPNGVDPLYDPYHDFDYRTSVWKDHHSGGQGAGVEPGDQGEHMPDRPDFPTNPDAQFHAPEHAVPQISQQ